MIMNQENVPDLIAYWNRFLDRARASRTVEDDRGLLRPVSRGPRQPRPLRFYWSSWAAAKDAWLEGQKKD
jgi:hypothetical protein